MKGQKPVVDYLNELLRGELTARDQYFLHSRRFQDMGFTRLYERTDHEMQEETDHADAILQRILFLEGVADMRPFPLETGPEVPDMLRADLKLEYHVREALAKGVELAEQHGDYVTRAMLREQIKETEEDHAYWLEKQFGLIEKMGLENYLQSQAK